jgi:hypothetical protein
VAGTSELSYMHIMVVRDKMSKGGAEESGLLAAAVATEGSSLSRARFFVLSVGASGERNEPGGLKVVAYGNRMRM